MLWSDEERAGWREDEPTEDPDFLYCHCCLTRTHLSELVEVDGEGKCCGPCAEEWS